MGFDMVTGQYMVNFGLEHNFLLKPDKLVKEMGIVLREVTEEEQNHPDLRALNPLGKTPALVLADGSVVPEADVILRYLCEKYPGELKCSRIQSAVNREI